MDSLQKISNDLVDSINEKEKKKAIPYDTYAKVIRIDSGTAWVHIPGGVDETPVALTVNAKVGDSVLVRVSGGNAWIVGNSSAPPTDDTKAAEAKDEADVARAKAASAQETAESAEEIAKDASRAVKSTSQYFWHTETDTGAGAGAHITEVPQEDFLDDPANGGGNLLAQSSGIKVRNGLQELAAFGNDGLRLGTSASPLGFFGVGSAFLRNYYIGDGTGSSKLTCTFVCNEGEDGTLGKNYREDEPYFTFGTRAWGKYAAPWSWAIGEGIIGRGVGTVYLGRYNLEETGFFPDGSSWIGNALVIGNGANDNSRSNALTVDQQGNVDMAGKLQNFFSIVNLEVAVGQVAAHAQNNIGTVTVPTADQPDGMTLVGIVGVACNNYRVVPYNYYVNGAHSITCAVVNTTTAQSAAGTTMTFKLLYAKMASA